VSIHWGQFIRGALVLGILVAGLIWLIVRSTRNAEDPARMAFKWCLTLGVVVVMAVAVPLLSVFGLFVIVGCAAVLSYMWTPHIGEVFAKPLTSLFDGGNLAPEPRPLYSVAQSKQKKGQYLEAVQDIRKQLERFPSDFEGHMLLAQIQAEDLKDIEAAEMTVQRLCAQPGHAPKNITFALYSLADWQLQVGDREAAERALQQVIDLLPDTEYALNAAQRIAHLGNAEILLGPHEPKKFALTEHPRHLGIRPPAEPIKPQEKDPAEAAMEYVKQLERHPLDNEAREQLAAIYVDHYHRLDLAADQIEQMVQEPRQPHKLVVRWLNLLADLQIRSGADLATVKKTLQRIIDLDPKAAAAETAWKRIALVKLELKVNQEKQSVKLGSYEQNIGLKRSSTAPPRPS
jgi:tetratricopeptide (TPR) repeat protein